MNRSNTHGVFDLKHRLAVENRVATSQMMDINEIDGFRSLLTMFVCV